MAEVATAYVSLIPSFRGGKKAIEKGLTGAIVPAGRTGGQRAGVAAAAALGSGLRKGSLAVTAAVVGTMGVALKKGFSRLANIEDATAKLRGLGHSAKTVETIMTNALNAVRGTAFGLDEAATVAAGVVAAGIKPGKELENTLKLVADAATIAGTSMGEMGAIFNKVAAANRLSMEEVNQLSDRGVPIMQMLAKEFGVTAAEARKMVSEGEVDFKRFRKVMQDNLAGAALESGNTTRGAFANLGAALSRFGAALLSGVFPYIKDVFNQLIVWIDNLTEKAGPFASTVGEKIANAFKTVVPLVKAFINGLRGGTAGGGGPIVAWTEAGNALRDAYLKLLPVIQQIWSFITGTLIPAIASVVSWIIQNRQEIGEWIKALAMAAGPVLAVVGAVKTFIGALNLAKAAFTALRLVMMTNPFGLILTAVVIVAAVIIKNWDSIKAFLSATWNWIKKTADTIWTAVKTLFMQRLQQIRDTFNTVWNAIKTVITVVWNAIKTFVTTRIDSIKTTIRNAWNTVKTTTTNAWNLIREGVSNSIGRLMELVRGIPRRVKDGLGNLGRLLLDSGKRIIQGLIDGIKSRIRDVKNAVGDVLKSARDMLPFSPAKEGPFSGRGWTLYSGRSIVEDLAKGINQRSKLVEDALSNALTVPSAPYAFGAGRTNMIGGDTHVTVILDGEPIRAVVRREVSEHDRHLRRRVMSGMGAAR